jgi:hypothetical protein
LPSSTELSKDGVKLGFFEFDGKFCLIGDKPNELRNKVHMKREATRRKLTFQAEKLKYSVVDEWGAIKEKLRSIIYDYKTKRTVLSAPKRRESAKGSLPRGI